MQTIVLASASPRRSELLSRINIPFVALPADVDESTISETPDEYTQRLAQSKATHTLDRILASRESVRRDAISEEMLLLSRILDGPAIWVLGADTVIDLDGAVLGKAGDDIEAKAMIESLSGRAHDVVTGICLVKCEGETNLAEVESVRTRVRFGNLTNQEIESYIESGDWKDAAGAYRIQSLGETLIESIEGSYSNAAILNLAV